MVIHAHAYKITDPGEVSKRLNLACYWLLISPTEREGC